MMLTGNDKYVNWKAIVLCFTTIIVSGCAKNTAPPSSLQTSCMMPDAATAAAMAAEDHYHLMMQCYSAGQRTQVTTHYALAGVKTWLNAHRQGDQHSQQQHQELLQQTLHKIPPSERKKLWTVLHNDLSNPIIKRRICAEVEQTGKMSTINDQVAQWDWQNAMDGYLHCGGSITL
ncbi:hypothetical protein [Pantoea sp. SORGH_AS_0659]|uniref:hypothetical protein n=1 Tax=Pantoea sp. SORGH_AS_0659 TaxID=3062597 RepID=UPI00286029DA|nr:hypothetical protein [Pantoea sp. SORGH_AS_0659]MDR6352502.1 hypothetical protein [Pantoea sp. SORGH_AS_0659]